MNWPASEAADLNTKHPLVTNKSRISPIEGIDVKKRFYVFYSFHVFNVFFIVFVNVKFHQELRLALLKLQKLIHRQN